MVGGCLLLPGSNNLPEIAAVCVMIATVAIKARLSTGRALALGGFDCHSFGGSNDCSE